MESRDETLARLIQEFTRRLEAGEDPVPEEYRAVAGDSYEEFLELVEIERLLGAEQPDAGEEKLPRRFGPYTLLSVLGEGGFGRVYRAFQSSLGRPVALKVLRGAWAGDPELMGRFRRGAKAAAQVEHDHVVRILDYGSVDDRPYLAMSCLPGPSLHQLLVRLRAVSSPRFGEGHAEALRGIDPGFAGSGTVGYARWMAALLAGVAEALAEYHDRGICHRDVKPGNLLFDSRGRLVLTDFDLAKGLDTRFLTAPDQPPGTPGYMSPEQLDPGFGEVGGRSDIYALGVVLYESITLQRPFQGEQGRQRLEARVLREEPVDPAKLVPDLPDGVVRVVRKAMQKRPEDRYPDSRTMAADLRAAAKGEMVRPAPVPWSRRIRRGIRRWKVPITAALMVLIATVAAFWPKPASFAVSGNMPEGVQILLVPLDDVDVSVRHLPRWETVEAPPGRYEIRVSAPEWTEQRIPVFLARGQNPSVEVNINSTNPEWREILSHAKLTGNRRAERDGPPKVGTIRGGDPLGYPLTPAGAVRRSDLTALIAEVRSEGRAALRVRDASGSVIYEADLELEGKRLDLDFPPEFAALLEEGETYRWSVGAGDTGLTCREFRLVADLAAEKQRAIDDLESAVPPGRRPVVTALMLQREGLHQAALLEFIAALAGFEESGTGAPALWDPIHDSLAALGLLDSHLANALYERTRELGSSGE